MKVLHILITSQSIFHKVLYFLCFHQSSSTDLALCNDCFAFR